jgi:hypothetical protein
MHGLVALFLEVIVPAIILLVVGLVDPHVNGFKYMYLIGLKVPYF